jgi:hypothetical protein
LVQISHILLTRNHEAQMDTLTKLKELDSRISEVTEDLSRLYDARRAAIAAFSSSNPNNRPTNKAEMEERHEQAFRLYLADVPMARISKLFRCSAKAVVHRKVRELSRPENSAHDLHEKAKELHAIWYPSQSQSRECSPGENDETMLTPIDELGLSIRTTNCLMAENIRNLLAIDEMTDAEIKEIQGLGRKSLCELRNVIAHIKARVSQQP